MNGMNMTRNKTIAPYATDTVQVAAYSIVEMPATHQQYGETATVRMTGYVSDGREVSVVGEADVSLGEVMGRCADLNSDRLMDSIRFLIDNGVLNMGKDNRLSKGNKKSRHK